MPQSKACVALGKHAPVTIGDVLVPVSSSTSAAPVRHGFAALQGDGGNARVGGGTGSSAPSLATAAAAAAARAERDEATPFVSTFDSHGHGHGHGAAPDVPRVWPPSMMYAAWNSDARSAAAAAAVLPHQRGRKQQQQPTATASAAVGGGKGEVNSDALDLFSTDDGPVFGAEVRHRCRCENVCARARRR